MPRKKKRGYGFEYKPPLEVIVSPGEFIVDEVSTEADVRLHPDILWYGNMNNSAECFADFSIDSGIIPREEDINGVPINGDPNGEKFCFVDVPEFGTGVRGMRWKSRSLITNWPDNTNGSDIMNMRKYINSANGKPYSNGSFVGSVARRDLYFRFCVYLENDVPLGFTESGLKLSGMERGSQPQADAGHVGTIMWHSAVGSPMKFYANTYWFGRQSSPFVPLYTGGPGTGVVRDTFNLGQQAGSILPWTTPENPHELTLNTWHTFEVHLRLNTFTGSTPNPDGALEWWFNDQEVYSRSNFVLSNTPPGGSAPVNEILLVHAQIFHGGPGTFPSEPMHYRAAGYCLAPRRIGKPKTV